ncbi:rhodanese-like domain-containing protein [Polaromonas hydrogenivorans]|uniref:Rhodanese-like domain-containing protein n=1 Tax=Polaromonas hydrogenivorans TaxID=335476 RepID=A0AAU7LSZ0_9BURK
MKYHKSVLAATLLSLGVCAAFAQQASPAASPGAAAAADVWKYKTKRLDRAGVDALLAKPQKLVVIDVRRPDELTAKGSFPVYLNIQVKEVEKSLAYIPKDRAILTVSNHAHRAGAVGDLLTSKGFKVAGATGSEDYEAQGGTVTRVVPPPPKPATVSAAP